MTRAASRRPSFRSASLAALALAAILIPFALWGDTIETWSRSVLREGVPWPFGAAAVIGLLALDVLLPVPSSFVGVASGAILGVWGGSAASFIGLSGGCAVGYWLGHRSANVVGANGASADISRGARYRRDLGPWFVAALRPIPVLAEASVLYAGWSGMPLAPFALMTGISNLGVAVVYAAAGAAGAAAGQILFVFAAAVALPGLGLLILRRR